MVPCPSPQKKYIHELGVLLGGRVVEHLPSTCEALGLILSTTYKQIK